MKHKERFSDPCSGVRDYLPKNKNFTQEIYFEFLKRITNFFAEFILVFLPMGGDGYTDYVTNVAIV